MKVKPVGPSVCIGCDMGLRSGLIQQSIINYHRKIKTQNQRSNWTYLTYKWFLRDFIVPHSHEPTIQRCEKAKPPHSQTNASYCNQIHKNKSKMWSHSMAVVAVFRLAILVSWDFRLISKIIFHRSGGGEIGFWFLGFLKFLIFLKQQINK